MARIGLVVDNPSRDLKGLLLVARQLVARGHEAILIPMYSQGLDVPLLQLDAIVVNYAREVNRGLIASYKALGIHVAILDTEGGVVSADGADSPENWAKRIKSEGFDRLIDTYLFWGPRIREAFVKWSGLKPEQLIVTGCPRYDLTAPRWRPYFEYPHRDFVLLNTNYSAINPNFTQSEEEEISAFVRSGWDREYTLKLFKDWRLVLNQVVDVFTKLFASRPDQLFVLRPHPFENPDFYVEKFAGHANVRVVTEGDVFQAIAHSKLIVHLNCGTAIEGLLMGKLPVNIEYLNTDLQRMHTPLPRLLSVNAGSFEELLGYIDHPGAHARELEARIEAHIAPWFGPLDGSAADRVASALDVALREKRSPHLGLQHVLQSLRSSQPRMRAMSFAQGLIANLTGTRSYAKFRERLQPARKVKSFSTARLSAELARMSSIETASPLVVKHARHPLTSMPLSSIEVTAAER